VRIEHGHRRWGYVGTALLIVTVLPRRSSRKPSGSSPVSRPYVRLTGKRSSSRPGISDTRVAPAAGILGLVWLEHLGQ